MITLINRHHFKEQPLPQPHVYIGRGTPLGNAVSSREKGAFFIGNAMATPQEALAAYEDWLRNQVSRRDPAVMAALNSIGPDHFLVCSCAPAPCHGEAVARVAEWLHGKGEW